MQTQKGEGAERQLDASNGTQNDGGDPIQAHQVAPSPAVSVIQFHAHAPLAKRAWAVLENGTLVLKKAVGNVLPAGYEAVLLPVDGWAPAYAALVEAATPTTLFCHAALKDGAPPEGGVRTKQKVIRMRPEVSEDFISRSLDYLTYPEGPGVALFDSDEPLTPEEFDERLAKVLPQVSVTARVSYPSSGSFIYTEDGTELRGASGLHTAILVKDATDNKRMATVLHARLVLAGDYRVIVDGAGRLHLRSIIDLQMFNPAQPEFPSGCYLDNEKSAVPLVQRRPPPTVRPGEPLDTRALVLPLTPEEKDRYRSLREQALKENAAAISAGRSACRVRIAARAVEAGADQERADVAARELLDDRVLPPLQLQTNDGTAVPVEDVIAAPHEWSKRGWIFRDVLEPDYGTSKARVFVKEDGSVVLQSMAHGGRTYRIGFDADTAITMLKASTRKNKVDLWFSEYRVHFLGGDASMAAVFASLKSECKVPIGALKAQELEWRSRATDETASRVLSAEDIEVAEAVRDEYGGNKYMTYAEDLVFRGYDGKKWAEIPDHHVEAEAQRTALDRREDIAITAKARGWKPPQYKQSVTSVATTATEALRRLLTRGEDFTGGDRPPLMNFQNGTLDLQTMELRAHSPKDRLTFVTGFDYDPQATSPAWDELLDAIWPGMPEVHRHLEEVLGYIVQPERFLKVIVVAWGSGFNGKTPLFFRLLLAILGEGAVGPMDLHLFNDDKFASADPVGKLVLIEDDMKVGTLWPDGPLKKLSERSLLRGERKGKQGFAFINNSVPVVLGNSVARVRDGSLATAERIQAFRFEHSFKEGNEAPYDKATAERLFGAVLGAELPGVVNRLIAGFARVKERVGRGGFDVPAECIAWRQEYLREGNQVLQFVAEKTAPGDTTDAATLYDAYRAWCRDSHRLEGNTVGRNTFYERLREAGHPVKEGRARALKVYGLRLRGGFEEVGEAADASIDISDLE
jgi:putative DNA primase/helicase